MLFFLEAYFLVSCICICVLLLWAGNVPILPWHD